MQVTGNNLSQKDMILSIRLTPNGLYFAINEQNKTWVANNLLLESNKQLEKTLKKNKLISDTFSKVELSICSKDCMLIPEEFEGQLQSHKSANYRMLSSQSKNDMVEISPIANDIMECLEKIYGSRLTVCSTMLSCQTSSKELTYSIAMYGKICCFVISENGLITLAQNLPCDNHADILYYLNMFADNNNCNVEIVYDSSEELAKKLKPYYKNIKSR